MFCAKRVFRCFRAFERLGDRITGAAGPYFIFLAVVLISTGTISFFDVIAPSLSFQFFSVPLCMLIAVNLFMHYFYVCTVRPGFVDDPPREQGSGIFWARRRSRGRGVPVAAEGDVRITHAVISRCRKCGVYRPERAHHCRICGRCVLKYDHHCPVRINQCVGLHNERHFVMFMAYLVLSTFCYSVLGYHAFFDSLGISFHPWPHRVPELAFALTYILGVVMCLAVGVMLGWHLWGIAHGETTVEAQDHEEYRKAAKERGEMFVNSYDLGKWNNLRVFFNLGRDGYPLYTLVLPLRMMPYTDGRAWARCPGYDRHFGVRQGEELTDDEDEEE